MHMFYETDTGFLFQMLMCCIVGEFCMNERWIYDHMSTDVQRCLTRNRFVLLENTDMKMNCTVKDTQIHKHLIKI